jgi:hypothetical protein
VAEGTENMAVKIFGVHRGRAMVLERASTAAMSEYYEDPAMWGTSTVTFPAVRVAGLAASVTRA